MKLACDLHIHSCLSPCGDELMTPNNICGMAKIKELDAVALTDHNSAHNLPAMEAAADNMGLVFLPGIEAQTAEETHILCYFLSVEAAITFGGKLYETLPDIPNRPEVFGEQLILNADDEIIGREGKLLLQSSEWDIARIAKEVAAFGGVCVPAHVNRESFSVLYNLGVIPSDAGFTSVEVFPRAPLAVSLDGYRILRSSDAHYIEDILEREFFIEARSADRQGVFDYVRRE